MQMVDMVSAKSKPFANRSYVLRCRNIAYSDVKDDVKKTDEQIRQNYCPQYFVFVNGKMRLQVACVDGKFWETSEKIDIFLSGFWYGNMYNK